MKNFQKLALSLIVGVMAIGFSAFTSGNSKVATASERYYNVTGDKLNHAASNFIYAADNGLDCSSNPDKECSAIWNTTNAPTLGQSPVDAGSPSLNTSSIELGERN